MDEFRACSRGFRIAAATLTDAVGLQLLCFAAAGIAVSAIL